MMALALLAASLPAVTASSYVPPEGAQILTRTLRRALPDGKEIVATRRYEVRIVSDHDGYRVEGRLLTATVEAPPALEALAAIERTRSDAGLFPFRLDARGMIASAAFPADRTAAQRAAAATRQATGSLPEPEQRQAAAFADQLAGLSAAASGARWPEDLFAPRLGTRSTADYVAAADGIGGQVRTTITAERFGRENSIERTVVTRIGAQERTTRETYTLAPASGD